jgi:hypothetical protein
MAAVTPKTMMAIERRYRIAPFSPAFISPAAMKTTREAPKRKMRFRKGAVRER